MDFEQKNIQLGIKLVAIALLFGMVIIGYMVRPDVMVTIWSLSTSGDIDGTVEFLRSFGVWAMVISILIDVIINVVGFLPSIFISTANGVIFGIIPGIIISWFAETVGVILSFLLFRTLLRHSAEEIIDKSNMLKKLDELSGTNGFKVMLFARSLPYFPSGIVTALGAVSRISVKDYILSNMIGKFPSTALEVLIGHDVVNYEENMGRLALVVVGATLVYAIYWQYHRRSLKETHPVEKETE